ncbi:MAG: response regulator [Phycisphaeraceae bacterium]
MQLPDRNSIPVHVIDDDPAVRDSLRWLLESEGLTVLLYPDADTFLESLTLETTGCVLLDVRLPGMSGVDLMEKLAESEATLKVIMISGHADVTDAVRSMKAGAIDFVEKPFPREVLLSRVHQTLEACERQQSEDIQIRSICERLDSLTPRESTVMKMVVRGMLNKQIATELGLSQKTVEVHRAHVMQKMHATSLAELVRMSVAIEELQLAEAVA